ncbi:MAG: CaiB/BaiF CoA transferase family protein [Acidimicrobiales bacterium]
MTDSPTPSPKRSKGPLDGLVIADFSRILAGPYATMLLGDLGATVIKVEGPGGDDTRTWIPPERNGIATYYLGINRNKRSIVLDLKNDEDLVAAKALVDRADIMIENFKPGQLGKFGLDYASVHARNERLIVASISGFGSKGTGAKLMGYDLMVQALSGLMSLTGDSDGPPYRAGISAFDIIAGLHATIGILAALEERHRTGRGQHVEVSLLASALSGLANHTTAVLAADVIPFRMGNAHPSLHPYELFPTKDGDLIVIAGNDGQFRSLMNALGRPEIGEDPLFARNESRTQHRGKLVPILTELLADKTAEEWFEILNAAGVPSAPIVTVDQGIAFAESFGLEPTISVELDGTPLELIRNPILFSETPPTYRLSPPSLGADTALVKEWLAGRSELNGDTND